MRGFVLPVSLVAASIVGLNSCAPSSPKSNAAPSPAAKGTPTPTALWANRQVDVLLAGGPDTLPLLAAQLKALAIVEGGDSDAALPMDLRPEEMEGVWGRVREKYDTEWVRGYMTTNTRAAFVHTLASLCVRSKAPALFAEVPGAFDADAERWPAWVEAHKAQLGMN